MIFFLVTKLSNLNVINSLAMSKDSLILISHLNCVIYLSMWKEISINGNKTVGIRKKG